MGMRMNHWERGGVGLKKDIPAHLWFTVPLL